MEGINGFVGLSNTIKIMSNKVINGQFTIQLLLNQFGNIGTAWRPRDSLLHPTVRPNNVHLLHVPQNQFVSANSFHRHIDKTIFFAN